MKPPRKPRDPYNRTNVQFGFAINREVADLIRTTAAARGVTIVSLVEQSVRAFCQEASDAPQTTTERP